MVFHIKAAVSVVVFLTVYNQSVDSARIVEEPTTTVLKENFNDKVKCDSATNITLLNMEDERHPILTFLNRIKRHGAGKFTDAAKSSQSKTGRLFLQMFSNPFSSVYVGGAHPLHHEIPKPIVFLVKYKIFGYFFPSVGQPSKTQ